LAIALQRVINTSLEVEVFCASDDTSIPLGEKGEQQITEAHRQSKAIVVLVTPRSLFRPWVIYESGGAHFHTAKPLFIVLANGATIDCLPAPLKAWQAGDLSKRECIENLCSLLSHTTHRNVLKRPASMIRHLQKLASPKAGEWASVHPSLVVENWSHSPFRLEHFLNQALPDAAKKAIFLIGPTLHSLTRSSSEDQNRGMIFDWLKADGQREFCIVISDMKTRQCMKGWSRIFPDRFDRYITQSTKILRKWAKAAATEKLHFQVRALNFIPFTIYFIDPREPNAILLLTPIIYNSISQERPHFVINRQQHTSIFDYYWNSYSEQINDNSVILS
jgi:hypothetical protein